MSNSYYELTLAAQGRLTRSIIDDDGHYNNRIKLRSKRMELWKSDTNSGFDVDFYEDNYYSYYIAGLKITSEGLGSQSFKLSRSYRHVRLVENIRPISVLTLCRVPAYNRQCHDPPASNFTTTVRIFKLGKGGIPCGGITLSTVSCLVGRANCEMTEA